MGRNYFTQFNLLRNSKTKFYINPLRIAGHDRRGRTERNNLTTMRLFYTLVQKSYWNYNENTARSVEWQFYILPVNTDDESVT
jgi:hypothetical protein